MEGSDKNPADEPTTPTEKPQPEKESTPGEEPSPFTEPLTETVEGGLVVDENNMLNLDE